MLADTKSVLKPGKLSKKNIPELIERTRFLCEGMLHFNPTESDTFIKFKKKVQRLIFSDPLPLTNEEKAHLKEFKYYL